jgi:hypothetical protein
MNKSRHTRKKRAPTLRKTYGELWLPAGTLLYHSSQDPFVTNPQKPMLFTTFHPSEWYTAVNEYITPIKLNRPVSLLFMVGGFSRTRIQPLLNTLIGYPNTNLAKQVDRNLECYVRHLRADRFDGWFSTIEGRAFVEVALINDPAIFAAAPSHKTATENSNANNGGFRPQRFGTRYQFSPAQPTQPRLTVHVRYRPEIEQYMADCAREAPNAFACEALFAASQIRYRDGPLPQEPIRWECDQQYFLSYHQGA